MASVNPLPCSGQTPLKHNEITLNGPLSSLFSPISSLLSFPSQWLEAVKVGEGRGTKARRKKGKEEREWRGSENASPRDGEGEESDRKRQREEGRRGGEVEIEREKEERRMRGKERRGKTSLATEIISVAREITRACAREREKK